VTLSQSTQVTATFVQNTTADLTMEFTDSCTKYSEVDFKYYDETIDGVWPSVTQSYHIFPGETSTLTLKCTIGDKICLGADDSGNSVSWGVAVGNTEPCTRLYTDCATKTYQLGALVCN
jgi:hypothetical protein